MFETSNGLFINAVMAAAIIIIGFFIVKRVRAILKNNLKKHIDPMIASFLTNIAYVLMMALVVIAALGKLGVETTSLAAVIGAAGLAIGLSLKDSLANFASGVMIIAFRPFHTGDYIEAGGVSGVVEGIQMFSTQLVSPDNKHIIVPNAQITGSSIINYSTKDTRRVDLEFGIGYDDDIKKAKTTLQRLVKADKRILAEPEPVIAVSELADSSVNFVVRPWVKAGDYWDVKFELTEKVKLAFDKAGISIPFPQSEVHLHSNKSASDVDQEA